MEIKQAEKVVLAKPVASKPTCSHFRSFSELLAGAINASPSTESSQDAVIAIRPRTVRFKPAANHTLVGMVSSQDDPSGSDAASSYKVLKPERKSNVVYKPTAKIVSKATVSLLANMRSASLFQKQELAEVDASLQPSNLVKHQSDIRSELHENFLYLSEKDKGYEHSKMASVNLEEDQRSLSHMANGNRPSYDGYNWRKYGQKQVKGGEYPRSYYKCTHPNCPVKKKVERSLDGQIAEIVYKGEHNHSKQQRLKRNSSDEQHQGNAANASTNPLWNNQQNDKNDCYDDTLENQNTLGFSVHSSFSGRAPSVVDPVTVGASSFGVSTNNSSCHSGEFEEGRGEGLEEENDEPKGKRRKKDKKSNEAGTSAVGTLEPQIVAQSSIDSEILRDGFRWRKYGQKVVKGNSYPRSYYRCTSPKCNVRKYVERTSDDPNSFITTYEGKHNHEMPIKSTNSVQPKQAPKL